MGLVPKEEEIKSLGQLSLGVNSSPEVNFGTDRQPVKLGDGVELVGMGGQVGAEAGAAAIKRRCG